MKVDIIRQETVVKKETVEKQEAVELQEYWLIRGIKVNTHSKSKEVIVELEFETEPSSLEIAQFLADNPKAKFCSVEHNYRLKG